VQCAASSPSALWERSAGDPGPVNIRSTVRVRERTEGHMFAKILVGTDGSETAATAVEKARAIAALTGAELIVLHAYRTLPSVGDVGTVAVVTDPAIMAEDGRELLAHVEKQIGGTVPVRTTLQRGDPAHSLIDAAKQE